MADSMGDRVAKRVREQLSGLIEDEELDAMIDREIGLARQMLQSRVSEETRGQISALVANRLKAWLDTDKVSTWADEAVKKIVDEVVSALKETLITGHSEESRLGWGWGLRDAISVVTRKLDDLVKQRVLEKVEERWRNDERIDDIAEDVSKRLVPQAMAIFLQDATRRVMGVLKPELAIRSAIETGSVKACPHCFCVWETSGREMHLQNCNGGRRS